MPATSELILEHSHPPQLPSLSWSDRLALHMGLALIRWAERKQRLVRSDASMRFDSVEQRRAITEAGPRIGLVG